MKSVENFKLNFGPQHPAAHGVLRLVLELVDKTDQDLDVHIGLLHRGTERSIEYKNVTQAVPYFDRSNYLSTTMAQEHGFVSTVERLLNIVVPRRARDIRIIGLELTRILNHLLAVTTHVLDVGALTPFLWGFEEREKIMEFYETLSGARLHANFFKVSGVAQALPSGFSNEPLLFYQLALIKIEEVKKPLFTNLILCKRLVGGGQSLVARVLSFDFSAVFLCDTFKFFYNR